MPKKINFYTTYRNILKRAHKTRGINIDAVSRSFKMAVIEMHCILEDNINEIIDKYIFGEQIDYDVKITLEEIELYQAMFAKKIKIVVKILKKYPKIKANIKLLTYINTLRNTLAHNFIVSKDSKKLKYNGKLLTTRTVFNRFVLDWLSLVANLRELEEVVKKNHSLKASLYSLLDKSFKNKAV